VQVVNCYWLLLQMLEFTAGGKKPTTLFPIGFSQNEPVGTDGVLPSRRDDVNFTEYSAVLGKRLEVSLPPNLGEDMLSVLRKWKGSGR
jgi:hypothetical protein